MCSPVFGWVNHGEPLPDRQLFWLRFSGPPLLHVYGSRNMEQGYPYGNFNLRTGNVLSGYKIQSIFDPRFLDNPPPYSPTIGREIKFEGWRYARN
jgi:hypothetical protein